MASCVPQSKPDTSVNPYTAPDKASFYPHETGLEWSYVPEGETSKLGYTLRGLGPSIFQGTAIEAVQLVGRGADQTWYRTYDSSGVKLHGIRKPGATITLNPAWQEYPPANAWQVGLNWEGISKVVITDDSGSVQAKGEIKYRYDVQDYRQVSTPAGTFNVWVVTRQISDTVGGLFPAARQSWFTPYVGEVRTPEGLLLVSSNFATKGN